MKLSNVNGMCVSLWRFATSLGPWVNVQSHQCGSWVVLRWCEALVTNWKRLRGGNGMELMDDEVRVVEEEIGASCWPASIGTCNRIKTLLTGWPMGENEETYTDGLDVNDFQTHTATQPVWAIAVFRGMILTFIPLWMERYKCDSSLQQFDFWLSWCFELLRASFSFPRGNV